MSRARRQRQSERGQEGAVVAPARAMSTQGAWLAWLVAITALAAILRLVMLGRQGLWLDECSTMSWAVLPFREILAHARADCQAPAFYFAERVVVMAYGSGEWQARLLSALAGIATVALVAEAGRRIISPRAGLVAAFLLAISPMHVHYSREARNYSLVTLLLVVAFLAALRLHRKPGILSALAVAASFVAALYTHDVATVYLACLVAGFAIVALTTDREARRRIIGWWAAALVLAFAGYVAWLPTVVAQARRGSTIYTWGRVFWEQLFPWQIPCSLAAMSPGSLPPYTNMNLVFPWTAWAGGIALAAVIALGIARRRAWREPSSIFALAGAGLGPLVALFLYSAVLTPIDIVGRADAPALPFVMLLAAAGVALLPSTPSIVALVVACGLALAPLRMELTGDLRSPSRTTVRVISKSMQDGDVMIVTGTVRHIYDYYLAQLAPGVTVRSYPLQLEEHPSWIDWSAYDDDALVHDAETLATRLGDEARARGKGRAWLLIAKDGRGEVLANVLDKRFAYIEHDVPEPARGGLYCFDLTRTP